MSKLVKRNCGHCGRQIEIPSWRLKNLNFCSKSCSAKHFKKPREKVWLSCSFCGSNFQRDLGEIKRKRKRKICRFFCSMKCLWEGKKGIPYKKRERVCIICGQLFSVAGVRSTCSKGCLEALTSKASNCLACGKTFSHHRGTTRKFCSRGCSDNFSRPHRGKVKKVIKKCAFCDKTFEILPGLSKRRIYCSRYCSGKAFGARRSLEKRVELTCGMCERKFSRTQKHLNSFKLLDPKLATCGRACWSKFLNTNEGKVFLRGRAPAPSRSGFEEVLEEILRQKFKEVSFVTNDRSRIRFELDFFFPEFSSALEIDGPYHELPLFGQDFLEKTKRRDKLKDKICKAKGINLVRLSVTGLKANSEEFKELARGVLASMLTQRKS